MTSLFFHICKVNRLATKRTRKHRTLDKNIFSTSDFYNLHGLLFLLNFNCFASKQALLHSVPRGKMIVLDLFADVKPIWKSSSQFYGTPYIW